MPSMAEAREEELLLATEEATEEEAATTHLMDISQSSFPAGARIFAGILGAGLILAVGTTLFMGGIGGTQVADVPPGMPSASRRRRGNAGRKSGNEMLGLALVMEEGLGSKTHCNSNEHCASSNESKFCYEHACRPCSECEHAWDGADGTCGICGSGYPTKEESGVNRTAQEAGTVRRTHSSDCTHHSDCIDAWQPFCYDGDCAPCKECEYCHDGVDGTCGTCGNVHLLEQTSCEA